MWWITSNVLSSHFHNALKHIKLLFRKNFRIKCANKKGEVKQKCHFPATLWLFLRFSNTWGKEAYFHKILKIKIWKHYLLHAFSFKIPVMLYFLPQTHLIYLEAFCVSQRLMRFGAENLKMTKKGVTFQKIRRFLYRY